MRTESNLKIPLPSEKVRELIVKSQAGDISSRDILVESNIRLVWSVVQRFINWGYDPDDLFQIGSIGLIKAIDKFDLSYNVKFSTYAVPMIIGEIQRFLRDDGTIKVSRSLKETAYKVRRVTETLTKELLRAPTLNEISEVLELSKEEIVHALEAVKSPKSIHQTVYENEGDPITLLDQIAEEENNWFDKISLEEAIGQLQEREKIIVFLRYYKDHTQSEVAERLGISQVQVSRLEKRILEEIKRKLTS